MADSGRWHTRVAASILIGTVTAIVLSGCFGQHPAPSGSSGSSRTVPLAPSTLAAPASPATGGSPSATARPRPKPRPSPRPAPSAGGGSGGGTAASYPWHTDIVSTTFWVGEVFDPNASDGTQVYSTYDSKWMAHYGGCDGRVKKGVCETERRTARNGWFPTAMKPKENPFYLDLPYDDVNDPKGFAERSKVIPWAHTAPYARVATSQATSLMKNRWVELKKGGRTCYGQIEDAGPALYHDANYVFGTHDARPASTKYNGAGMDVSPALNGCLGYAELDGENDHVDWRFVDAKDVPAGPWRKLVTTSPIDEQ